VAATLPQTYHYVIGIGFDDVSVFLNFLFLFLFF
jgi:hypothetical protein